MKIKLDGAKIPTRAHETDAGLDLYARETAIIYAKENHIFDSKNIIGVKGNEIKQSILRT